MSTKMTKPVLKMMNKQIKYHIIQWANIIKLFYHQYVWKNTLWFEERSKCSIWLIDTKMNRTEVKEWRIKIKHSFSEHRLYVLRMGLRRHMRHIELKIVIMPV